MPTIEKGGAKKRRDPTKGPAIKQQTQNPMSPLLPAQDGTKRLKRNPITAPIIATVPHVSSRGKEEAKPPNN
jgi:hypothetical protein